MDTITVKARGIVWDTDGEDDAMLPNSATVTVDKELLDTDPDAVADALSDAYGFCVITIKAVDIVS